jgi:hypothetical protein
MGASIMWRVSLKSTDWAGSMFERHGGFASTRDLAWRSSLNNMVVNAHFPEVRECSPHYR